MVTRSKLLVALISFGVTIAATLLCACAIVRWPGSEPVTPPVDSWPKLQLIVDPNLRCPAPAIERRLYCPTIDATFAANGRRFVNVEVANGFGGERFQLVFIPTCGGRFDVRAMGRKSVDYGPPFQHVLDDLQGVVTVNTLDWQEREAIRVRCDLNFYDTESARYSSFEASSQATPTRVE